MSRRLIKSLVFGLSVLFACSSACADGVGRFTAVEGRVDILKSGEERSAPVIKGDIVSSGDIIRTKNLSKAEIKFTDDTVLRLAANTRLEIEEYILDQFRLRANGIINIQRGEIRAIISKAIGPANFFVNTPNASASVKGSDVFVFYQKSATGVLVKEGNFSVINNAFPDQPVDVSEGFISIVPPDQPPQKPRPYLDVERKRHEIQTATLPAPVKEDPSQIKAVVVDLSGEVKVKYAGTTTWQGLMLHDVFGTGDEIKTEENGMVEIRLDNGNTITLRPNSTIILERLRRDLKTGDYENLFEANFGNIRAKVEKLKGNSKFEIRTPTAVASVRGTIMYLSILPGLTKVFFEDGEGTFTSLISQISKIVGDGQTSSADDQGNVSDATDATDEEKSGWTSGWDTGEAEGYSPPEGGEGSTGDEGEGDEGGDTPDTGDDGGVYIPPDPGPDMPTPPEGPLTFSGVWDGREKEVVGSLYYNGNGSLVLAGEEFGFIGSTTPNWWAEESFPVLAIGEYNYDNEAESEPYIWNTPIFSYNDTDGSSTTQDGGVFYGYTAGIWNNEEMDGSAVAIYIDPDGNAGLLTSNDLSGNYYPFGEGEGEWGMWVTEGNLTPTQMVSTEDLGIGPEDFDSENFFEEYVYGAEGLYAYLYGGFFSGGLEFDGDIYGEYFDDNGERTYFIHTDSPSEPWGIYNLRLGYDNYYKKPVGATLWTAGIEGEGIFGLLANHSEDSGRWLGLTGGSWKDREIRGALAGLYLTESGAVGILRGDLFGIYEEDPEVVEDFVFGTWIGESVGTFVQMGEEIGIDLADFDGAINDTELFGEGFGSFEGGGSLEEVSIEGMALNIADQKWGIWAAGCEGIYEGPTSPFTLAVKGYSDYGRCWLGTVGGDWESGGLSGAFKGILMYGGIEGGIAAASMTGDVIGNYIDVDESGTGTWQAAGVGEWVEVTDLLTENNLGFTMGELEQFIMEVPITEVYANLLTGSQGFITAAAMDISLYNDWLWTALIYGTYDGAPDNPADWMVTLSEGTDSVTLGGTMWDDTANEWLADVAGTVDGNIIEGAAGGTCGDGEFEGVGAGTVVEN